MSAERLYSPAMLGAAVELAQYPPLDNATCHGEARSNTCGSTLALDLMLDDNGAIDVIGLRVRACAVGQASAAIFARHAHGLDLEEITRVHDRFAAWLDEEAPAPEWPDLALIAAARDYRGRHGAMLLPWRAAMAALSSAPASR